MNVGWKRIAYEFASAPLNFGSMQFARFMDASTFLRELDALRAFRGEYVGADLLERLEASGLLVPRLRIRLPEDVARRFWLEAHPITPRKKSGLRLDDIFLSFIAAQHIDGERRDDADIVADIHTDDDVLALRRTCCLLCDRGSSVGVDGEGVGGDFGVDIVFNADVDLRFVNVELYGGTNSLQLDYLVGRRNRVDDSLEDVVRRLAVEVSVGLGKWNELWSALEGVEGEDALALRYLGGF